MCKNEGIGERIRHLQVVDPVYLEPKLFPSLPNLHPNFFSFSISSSSSCCVIDQGAARARGLGLHDQLIQLAADWLDGRRAGGRHFVAMVAGGRPRARRCGGG